MDQNYPSVNKNTQYQSSKYFCDNSIDLEGTNIMSTFDNNSLKTVTIKPATTHECSTSNFVENIVI